MLVCAVRKALVDLGEDHDYFVLMDVGDRFVENDNLIELYLPLVYDPLNA